MSRSQRPVIELICVGTELLDGHADSHRAALALRLGAAGLRLSREAILLDDADALAGVVRAHGAAKAAVSNFTQWLAVHFSQTGVRVNAIAPGFFLTDQNRGLLTTADGGMTARGQTIIAHTPQRHYGKPEDLLGAMLWLLSDQASGFVTGQVIAVDGGFSAFSGV